MGLLDQRLFTEYHQREIEARINKSASSYRNRYIEKRRDGDIHESARQLVLQTLVEAIARYQDQIFREKILATLDQENEKRVGVAKTVVLQAIVGALAQYQDEELKETIVAARRKQEEANVEVAKMVVLQALVDAVAQFSEEQIKERLLAAQRDEKEAEEEESRAVVLQTLVEAVAQYKDEQHLDHIFDEQKTKKKSSTLIAFDVVRTNGLLPTLDDKEEKDIQTECQAEATDNIALMMKARENQTFKETCDDKRDSVMYLKSRPSTRRRFWFAADGKRKTHRRSYSREEISSTNFTGSVSTRANSDSLVVIKGKTPCNDKQRTPKSRLSCRLHFKAKTAQKSEEGERPEDAGVKGWKRFRATLGRLFKKSKPYVSILAWKQFKGGNTSAVQQLSDVKARSKQA